MKSRLLHSAIGPRLPLLFLTLLVMTFSLPAQTFVLGVTNQWVSSSAGTNSVVFGITPGNSPWTATANAPWLHLSPTSQTGAGSTNIIYTYDQNLGATRVGTVAIGILTLTVTQAGTNYVAITNTQITLVPAPYYDLLGGCAVDHSGNVFFATDGPLSEWVAASNLVENLTRPAGGLSGFATDSEGNVYITEQSPALLAEWITRSNILVTLVSNGLNYPSGVAVDSTGNVYIADQGNLDVWMATNHVLNTLISNLETTDAIAVDAAGNIYIGSFATGGSVQEWNQSAGPLTTVVSNLSIYPFTICVDVAGNLFFKDVNGNGAYKWEAATGAVNIISSQHLAGVAVDSNDNLYCVPYNSDYDGYYYGGPVFEIANYLVDTTQKTEPASAGSDSISVFPPNANVPPSFVSSDQPWLGFSSGYNQAVKVSFTANRNVTSSNRLGHISLLGQTISFTQQGEPPLLGTTNVLVGPQASSNSVLLAISSDWTATANSPWLHLAAASQNGTGDATVIFSVDTNSGPTRIGTVSVAGLNFSVTQAGGTYQAFPSNQAVNVTVTSPVIESMQADAVGDLYFSDLYYPELQTGFQLSELPVNSSTVVALATNSSINVDGWTLDANGNLFLSDANTKTVKEWVAATGNYVTIISNGLNAPYGLAFDAAGRLYLSDEAFTPTNTAIERWDPINQTLIPVVILTNDPVYRFGSPLIYAPWSFYFDVQGNIYLSIGEGILKWNATNGSLAQLISPQINQNLEIVGVDGQGNVYVWTAEGADEYGPVYRWSPATMASQLYAGLEQYPPGTLDGAQNYYSGEGKVVSEVPHAFFDTTPKFESSLEGTDALPPVLPMTENMGGNLAPTSSQSWLAITGVANGVVNFAFTANTSGLNRSAVITVLGMKTTVMQFGRPILTGVSEVPSNGGSVFQFSVTNINQSTSFTVLFSTNLTVPLTNWMVIGTASNVAPGLFQFADTNATDSQRFYTVRSP